MTRSGWRMVAEIARIFATVVYVPLFLCPIAFANSGEWVMVALTLPITIFCGFTVVQMWVDP